MRPNNFDIIRLLLAGMVVFVHSYDLSGEAALSPIRDYISSRLAVECFFVISGFLIFASYERCATLKEYYANRAWRILPAYWLSTTVCLLIAFSRGIFHVGKFLLANLSFLTFLHPNIDGVFDHNPGNPAMNGALWTIKIEVMFYVLVPVLVWLGRRVQRDAVLWSCFVLSLIYHWVFRHHESMVVQLPGQLSFFMAGAIIYYHLPLFKRRGWWAVAAAVVLFAASVYTGWFALRPAAVGVLVLAACFLVPHFEGPARYGDFSYGTYILHYPIVQLMVEAGFFHAHPWGTLALTVGLVAVAAVLSWNFVEKPSLAHAKNRKVRQAALGNAANYPPAVP